MKKVSGGALLAALFIFYSSIAFCATTNFSAKKSSKEVVIESPLKTFREGERLVYEVSWMGVPVGLGTLEVKEKVIIGGREAFHVVAVAQTNDFLSKLFPVRDEVHSFIDAERFCSLEFRKTVQEGRYRADERIVYDYGQKKGFYESFHNRTKKEFEIGPAVQDALSAFYWFRLQAIKPKESLRTVLNDEEKNWDLEIEFLKTQTKELRGREPIPVFLVEPKTSYRGILYNRGRAWVYFSADARRIPVWITLKTPFGPVNGVLKSGL